MIGEYFEYNQKNPRDNRHDKSSLNIVEQVRIVILITIANLIYYQCKY